MARARVDVGKLDPGALMAPSEIRDGGAAERDPRAVARGQLDAAPSQAVAHYLHAKVRDVTASALASRVRMGTAKARVLYVYAAYCPACRKATPRFVELVRSYPSRDVQFTAASVDDDRDQFTAYAPVLEGMLEPLWIAGEGQTRAELARLGIQFSGSSGFSIPLVAVFDRAQRVVAQGNGGLLRKLPLLIDELTR